ncbi:uracil-DNA glycosylase family protein [Lachnospiraceae bacterium YH-ros2228]
MINNPKNLMMSISNCDEVERAKEDSNHPCYKIVHYQYIENQRKVFQHPEPWNGNIEKAAVLFVGSNPSIDFDEDYPTDEWCDNDIYKFHYDRFSVSNDYYQKNKNKVKFWQCMRKIASWLLEKSLIDDSLDASICATEIVHCKSKKEIGVRESCYKCTKKWMTKVLSNYKGTYIVVLGKTAEPRFKRIVSGNAEYFKNKKIIYAPHPSRWCYIGKDFEIKELIMNQL